MTPLAAARVPPADAPIAPRRIKILVRGAVQGVGFRPFVYRRATALGLVGWVGNTTEGVTIEVEGESRDIEALIETIRSTPPSNAVISGVETCEIAPCHDAGFSVHDSDVAGEHAVHVPPDLATCPDCLTEMYDPSNRRYRYPFTNCTQCGPRYSIIEDIPYDRARTSMRDFIMCAACRAEYEDPANRRFHAEPNACPDCGPRLALWDSQGSVLAQGDDALSAAAAALRAGRIVAVKGIGGFHLLVDARDETAVRRLRAAKHRDDKPFAVMFPSLKDVQECCELGPEEAALLSGPARPIVLSHRKGSRVAPSVAPGNPRIGALLPYAPIHHLLLGELGFPVVATSGNISDEPIATDETSAVDRLAGVADLFLVHDRPIVRPIDDSVAQIVLGEPQLLRRARGYAPAPIATAGAADGILAFGSHLKATVALSRNADIVLSQHIGDLETVAAREAHGRAIADICRLHATRPRLAVCDLHPDYASRRAADAAGLPVLPVQHHLAHVAACMAENGLSPPVLGVAWDGTGYGPDHTIWGGEFLLVDDKGWRRVAHLHPFRLPGGEAAVREPRRPALGMLFEAFGEETFAMEDLPPIASFTDSERAILRATFAGHVNTPVTTSAGRLFDGFAALCGLFQRAGYEGQAASAFEWAAHGHKSDRAYALPISDGKEGALVVDWRPALVAALSDLRAGQTIARVSKSLHDGLAAAIAAVATNVGARQVVLTGGCFQNVHLTESAVAAIRAVGSEVHWHRSIPPNDGGIALGQAVWAAWSEAREGEACVSRFRAKS